MVTILFSYIQVLLKIVFILKFEHKGDGIRLIAI